MKRVVICGSYGMSNLGDESIVEVMIHDLFSISKKIHITVLVRDQEAFIASHRELLRDHKNVHIGQLLFASGQLTRPGSLIRLARSVWAILLCDLFIWGGGGLIRDWQFWLRRYFLPLRLAQVLRKPIVIWSIGVDRITNPTVISLVNTIRHVRFFAVRDIQSREHLLRIHHHIKADDVHVIRDPVFHIGDVFGYRSVAGSSEPRRVGLNITSWKGDLSDEAAVQRSISATAQALNGAYEHTPFSLIYLPTVPVRDDIFMDALRKELRSDIVMVFPKISSPRDYLDQLGGVQAFVGMRLHSIILASNVQGLPIAGIIYDEKVENLRSEKKLKHFHSIDEVTDDPSILEKSIIDCLAHPEQNASDFQDVRDDSRGMTEVVRSLLFPV